MIIFLGNDRATKLYSELIEDSRFDKDIVVSCQYRYRIPESLIKSHICVNIHYGILPEFAGCYPIYYQMIESDVVGVTLHYVDEDFDSGDIISQKGFPHYGKTADECYDACEKFGFELFKRSYRSILDGTANRKKQDKSLRKYRDAKSIDFSKAKVISEINDTSLRALTFKGKQFPQIKVGKRVYEIRCNDDCL